MVLYDNLHALSSATKIIILVHSLIITMFLQAISIVEAREQLI